MRSSSPWVASSRSSSSCCPLYAYALSGLSRFAAGSGSTTPVTLGLSLLLIGASFAMMRRLGYPIAFYGLATRGWRRAVLEAVIMTIPLCGVVVALKWLLLRVAWGVAGTPAFDPFAALNLAAAPNAGAGTLILMAALYAGHAPLQVYLVRGTLQSPLQHFLAGSGGHWSPIIASNVIFSAFHLYVSFGFALVTFIRGCSGAGSTLVTARSSASVCRTSCSGSGRCSSSGSRGSSDVDSAA